MNLKPVTLATLAALYAAAVGAAAGSSTGSSQAQVLQPVPLAQLQQQQREHMQNATQPANNQRRPGGLNQQIRPASINDKFQPEAGRTGQDVYIVRLHDMPVATYDGRIKGYEATSRSALKREAAAKEKLTGWQKWLSNAKDVLHLNSNEKSRVASYKRYLLNKHQDVMQVARQHGIQADARLHYTNAVNGFTVKMTQAQAQTLAALPQVKSIERSKTYKLTTDEGPHFIGADTLWAGNNVATNGTPFMGEGMVVGMIDTGVNTDHPSFAATGVDGYTVQNPLGAGVYLGDCANGYAELCNDKLIGVYSWPVITDAYKDDAFQPDGWNWWEPKTYKRPPNGEDYNNHGSHTASTAAGNVVLNVPLLGSTLGDGDGVPTGFSFSQVSGVAPHANIISYQACYPGDGGDVFAGCPGEALMAAVDQAITDNVDVISMSIGGSETFPWESDLELAFLAAREAGISVAVSAGNSGNAAGYETMETADHTSPWLMTVAASTHDRVLDISDKTLTGLTGGDTTPPEIPSEQWGQRITSGISQNGITGNLKLAANYGDELCLSAFAPGTFSSTDIVVCKRGQLARVAKAANVAAGGAGGFVLINAGYPSDQDDLSNDVYSIPGIQIKAWQGGQLITWLSSGSGHMGTISATEITRTIDPAEGDMLASFSSRGPSSTYEGHLVPSISAPGVDIFAAAADEHPFSSVPLSRDWMMMSGTSMATPHVGGAMALLRQVHPNWTPSQVQSALQMTAKETVTFQTSPYYPAEPAGIYRAGAGRIDVAAAVDAGLVMDETASNFMLANPRNGGNVSLLNLPELVNMHCRAPCTWVRTVEATRDGTWHVGTETGEYSVRMSAIPESFTLRAGEKRAILIRADVLDSQSAVNNSEQEVWGKVTLTADDSSIPASHWPVALKFDHGSLPESVAVTAHRNTGSYHVSGLSLPSLANTTVRSYGLTKATVEDVTLPEDPDWNSPILDGDFTAAKIYTVDVPTGSKRLMVEVVKNVRTTAPADELWRRGDADVLVGIDLNGNGQPDFDSEAICYSTHSDYQDYCNINNPDAGTYWVVIHNFNTNFNDTINYPVSDTYRIATAVVNGSAGGDLRVTLPSSTDGVNKVDVDLNWTLNNAANGDVYYGAFDVGSAAALGSVGLVPVTIKRGVDDVSISTSQTRARPGDVIDVSLHVVENNTGMDRNLDLKTTLPTGLTVVPGSVRVNKRMQAALTVSGQTIRIAGVQQNSEKWDREYVVTTNDTDAMCRTPNYGSYPSGGSSNGGFVDLQKFGIEPTTGGSWADFKNNWQTQAFTLPLNAIWSNPSFTLYNNGDYASYPTMEISPTGFIQLDELPMFWPDHLPFPYYGFPDSLIGVFWKGSTFAIPEWWDGTTLQTPLNVSWSGSTGISIANTANEVVIQWDGAESAVPVTDPMTWETVWEPQGGDNYHFQTILNRNYRYDEGQYEVIMAYGDLDFGSNEGYGSVGLQSFHGPRGTYAPLEDYKGASYAYNNLKEKLKKDLVVCYDYVGPESTQFDLSFQVRVTEQSAGQDQLIHFVSRVSGMANTNVDQLISINGNLSLGAFSDQQVEENTTLEGLEVIYTDAEGGANTVVVSGDHISAVVHGNEPGDSFDIVPETNYEGSTVVTVSVYDNANPSDRASTSFVLNVTKGTDVVIPPAGGTSTSRSGGGGGAMPWPWLLVLLPMLGRRMRR